MILIRYPAISVHLTDQVNRQSPHNSYNFLPANVVNNLTAIGCLPHMVLPDLTRYLVNPPMSCDSIKFMPCVRAISENINTQQTRYADMAASMARLPSESWNSCEAYLTTTAEYTGRIWYDIFTALPMKMSNPSTSVVGLHERPTPVRGRHAYH